MNKKSNIAINHQKEIAISSTVRITTRYDIRDKFNPAELDTQGVSIGSGFFIDTSGYILTCNHVIANAVKIFINLPNEGKKNYKALIISVYPEMDIAILKIYDYNNKFYIKMGSSDDCHMGSNTIAIGYPLGDVNVKITKGIISGKKEHLMQTDTTINPGNSGGPLLNNKYEVIGINVAKGTGYATEGTGYTIPIDLFKTVMSNMLGYELINRSKIPRLALQYQDRAPVEDQYTEEIKIFYKPNLYCKFQPLDEITTLLLCHDYTKHNKTLIEGYMITSMYKKSPLAVCENPMKIYDILMEFDKKTINCYGDIKTNSKLGDITLNSYIMRCEINQKIIIKYFSVKTQCIVDTEITFKNEYLYQIPEIFYPQKYNYLIIDGIVICQLTLDHLLDIINLQYSASIACKATMYQYILLENREKPKIFISRILPNSINSDNKALENSEGCIIEKVNGSHVSSLEHFKSIYLTTKIKVDGKWIIHMEMSNREIITLCIKAGTILNDTI